MKSFNFDFAKCWGFLRLFYKIFAEQGQRKKDTTHHMGDVRKDGDVRRVAFCPYLKMSLYVFISFQLSIPHATNPGNDAAGGRVEHESRAAGRARDSEPAVGLLLLQAAHQHPRTKLVGEEVRRISRIHEMPVFALA